jgi:dTDP-4-amino-4,6-dideoxygalactose transaminase
LLLIEDVAQAHLAESPIGKAGSIGDVAAFSFYPSKNLGAMGNGGMVLTDDADLAKRVGRLRNYGAESKYYHTEMGTNSRLDSMQATILDLKLEYLAQWNQLRYQAAQYYDQLLAFVPKVRPLTNLSGAGHVYHLYVIVLEEQGPEQRQLGCPVTGSQKRRSDPSTVQGTKTHHHTPAGVKIIKQSKHQWQTHPPKTFCCLSQRLDKTIKYKF